MNRPWEVQHPPVLAWLAALVLLTCWACATGTPATASPEVPVGLPASAVSVGSGVWSWCDPHDQLVRIYKMPSYNTIAVAVLPLPCR